MRSAVLLLLCLSGCGPQLARTRSHGLSAVVQREAPIDDQLSRESVLRTLRPFDEFVRRCTSGPHRVYAVASVSFFTDGTVLDADIDTGDRAADECAERLLMELRTERFSAAQFTVRFPFRVYSQKRERVRYARDRPTDMTFEPDLCLWGASDDPSCRGERESAAVDCPR
jgi:hypothetical protein